MSQFKATRNSSTYEWILKREIPTPLYTIKAGTVGKKVGEYWEFNCSTNGVNYKERIMEDQPDWFEKRLVKEIGDPK